MKPIQALRYLQGFALGDGWIYNRLSRIRLYIYDLRFSRVIRSLISLVKTHFQITSSEYRHPDRLTGTMEWAFEIGGEMATKGLSLGLLKSPEAPFFLAGLWDADGNWSPADESHPLGQARLFGGGHRITMVKRSLRRRWGIRTGRKYVATREGHRSRIGNHEIVTRKNVYGTGVLAKGMKDWVELVGEKMILKRPDKCLNE